MLFKDVRLSHWDTGSPKYLRVVAGATLFMASLSQNYAGGQNYPGLPEQNIEHEYNLWILQKSYKRSVGYRNQIETDVRYRFLQWTYLQIYPMLCFGQISMWFL